MVKSLSPFLTVEPSVTCTSCMIPLTSGVTTVEEIGLMEPEADTESMNSPRVMNVVLVTGAAAGLVFCIKRSITSIASSTTIPSTMPTFINFFLRRILRWRIRLSYASRASASSSSSVGVITPIREITSDVLSEADDVSDSCCWSLRSK